MNLNESRKHPWTVVSIYSDDINKNDRHLLTRGNFNPSMDE